MGVAIVTGSGGLIGSETVEYLIKQGVEVHGIDNDLRKFFFGDAGSTSWRVNSLMQQYSNYHHYNLDLRVFDQVDGLFKRLGRNVKYVIHTAAQPSHDWSRNNPLVDFHVNALGTLHVLEACRTHCPSASVAHISTNKVYGDKTDSLPKIEGETRFYIDPSHPYAAHGFDENLSLDQSKHSIFGASKVAADIMAQEYKKQYGIHIGVFRGSCLTGPNHSAVQLHGFLGYLVKCFVERKSYTIIGHKGKQVRDNIHSYDFVNGIWQFLNAPHHDAVYNFGGGMELNCSILEAIQILEKICGYSIPVKYDETPRIGDPVWLIGDIRKFKSHYPHWKMKYDLKSLLEEMVNFSSRHTELKENPLH